MVIKINKQGVSLKPKTSVLTIYILLTENRDNV